MQKVSLKYFWAYFILLEVFQNVRFSERWCKMDKMDKIICCGCVFSALSLKRKREKRTTLAMSIADVSVTSLLKLR